MKNQTKNNMETTKRTYSSPEISVIKIDNEISIFMTSANPMHDPDESIQPDNFSINPFKLPNL